MILQCCSLVILRTDLQVHSKPKHKGRRKVQSCSKTDSFCNPYFTVSGKNRRKEKNKFDKTIQKSQKDS